MAPAYSDPQPLPKMTRSQIWEYEGVASDVAANTTVIDEMNKSKNRRTVSNRSIGPVSHFAAIEPLRGCGVRASNFTFSTAQY